MAANRCAPKPRLQRTPASSSPSPLNRKPLGHSRQRAWRRWTAYVERIGIGLAVLLGPSCSTPQKQPETLSRTTSSIPEETIGQQFGAWSISTPAQDPAYGYSEKSPVLVGGGFADGGRHTYRFLNALLGPTGQRIHYSRIGTCCPFKTPNSAFEGEGVLEVYQITYDSGKPARLYFNWYDSGTLNIPQGLTARKP